jgi:hypothetical protein
MGMSQSIHSSDRDRDGVEVVHSQPNQRADARLGRALRVRVDTKDWRLGVSACHIATFP